MSEPSKLSRRTVLGAGVALPLGALISPASCGPDAPPAFQFDLTLSRS